MSARRRMLDDVARLATGAAGLVQGAGREAETVFRVRLERLLDQMDLVPRDEFDAVKAGGKGARGERGASRAGSGAGGRDSIAQASGRDRQEGSEDVREGGPEDNFRDCAGCPKTP